MFPDILQRPFRCLLLSPLLLLNSMMTQALPDDWQQEMTVMSDRAELDRKTGIVIYQGHVVLVQGTLRIDADRLTVYRSGNLLERAIAEGEPAHYQQQVTAGKPLTKAEGLRIDYLAGAREITLTGNARLEQDGNLFSGEKIQYDMTKETVSASGGAPAAGTVDEPPSRIKMVIQPQTAAPADNSAPAAGQAQERP